VRDCVNPQHLRLLTNRENILCGEGIAAKNAVKTHCNREHEYSAENTILYNGKRRCRICRDMHNRNRYRRMGE